MVTRHAERALCGGAFVNNDVVFEFCVRSEFALERFAKEFYVVLFDVFIYVCGWYLYG